MRIRLYIGCCLLLFLSRSSVAQGKPNHAALAVNLTLSTNQSADAEYWVITTREYMSIGHKTLYEIIQRVYPDSIPVIDEANLPDVRYDLKIFGTNATDEDYWKALEPVLRERFSLIASKEKRGIEIYELRVKVNPPPGLKPSLPTEKRSSYTTNATSFLLQFTQYSMDDLENELNRVMPLPVYNATGLTNDYDFTLGGFALVDPKIATQSIKDLGLSLDKAKKEKDVLVIRKLHLNLLSVPK